MLFMKSKKILPLLFIFLLLVTSTSRGTTGDLIQRLTDLEDELDSTAESANIAAYTTFLIQGDELIWDHSSGGDHKGKEASMDSVYHIASLTKTVTATAVMTLVEAQVVDLDEDINTYLPFTYSHPYFPDIPTTLRHLLSHTAGLYPPDVSFYELVWNQNFTEPQCIDGTWQNPLLNVTNADVIIGTFSEEGDYYNQFHWNPLKEPGETDGSLQYSNLGFALAAYIVAEVTNQSFIDYVQDTILEPLGVTDAYFSPNTPGRSLLIESINDVQEIQSCLDNEDILFPDAQEYGAAGMWTSARAVSQFLKIHVNKGVADGIRIISEESIEEMHTTVDGGYGLGWWKQTIDGHTGLGLGYRAEMGIRTIGGITYGFFEIHNSAVNAGPNSQFIGQVIEEVRYNPDSETDEGSTPILGLLFAGVVIITVVFVRKFKM